MALEVPLRFRANLQLNRRVVAYSLFGDVGSMLGFQIVLDESTVTGDDEKGLNGSALFVRGVSRLVDGF